MRLWGPLGSKILWISDPLALHYILVKEAYSYEEPIWLMECGSCSFFLELNVYAEHIKPYRSLRITIGNGLLSATGG
jgi:hypothetical protein